MPQNLLLIPDHEGGKNNNRSTIHPERRNLQRRHPTTTAPSPGPMKQLIPLYIAIFLILTVIIAPAEDDKAPLPVKVAVLRNFPPQYSVSEKGQPRGFAIDVIEEIARMAGLDIEYRIKNNWAEMFSALKSGMIKGIGIRLSLIFANIRMPSSATAFARNVPKHIFPGLTLTRMMTSKHPTSMGATLVTPNKASYVNVYNSKCKARKIGVKTDQEDNP